MAGATQRRVRETMLDAGGYWRPLAAVARLLEELGELAELLERSPAPGTTALARESSGGRVPALAGELADLWIITAALADQFLADLAEPGAGARTTAPATGSLDALLATAGRIARVVNFYDGPKLPQAASELPSLREAIAAFHDALGDLATSLGVDLGAAVSEKLGVIRGRDMQRFAREDSDPSTARSLQLLAAAVPTSDGARLWGAPRLEADPRRSAAAMLGSLISFTRAAPAERLDGYAIAAPALPDGELDRWRDELLRALRQGGPDRGRDGRKQDPDDGSASVGVLAFNGVALGVEEWRAGGGPGPVEMFLVLAPGRRVLPRPVDDRA